MQPPEDELYYAFFFFGETGLGREWEVYGVVGAKTDTNNKEHDSIRGLGVLGRGGERTRE